MSGGLITIFIMHRPIMEAYALVSINFSNMMKQAMHASELQVNRFI